MIEVNASVDERRARRGLFGLGVVAAALILANLVLIQTLEADLGSTLVWLLAPFSVVVLLLALGLWLRSRPARADYLPYVAGWAFAGAILLGVSGVLSAYGNFPESLTVSLVVQNFVGWSCGGLLVGGLVGVYDAERRVAQSQTEQARREAEQLAESLSVLNRVLRHDIRNHATVLDGRLEMLHTSEDGDHVEAMRRQTRRIIELSEHARQIETILQTDEIETETVDVVDILDGVLEECGTTYPTANITADYPEQAPVDAHEFIDAAIRNVVENAIVHNHNERPTVDIAVRNGNGKVCVEVVDDGPGIPDHELSVRELSTESALKHSSGLGLWLVDWIVEQSNGHVEYETEDTDGTVVSIHLTAA